MPGQFLGHLGLNYIDGFHWSIQSPLSYDIGGLGSGRSVIVPANFVTDFNSIPRGLWNIFPPTQYGKSSIIHDWLYEGGVITERSPGSEGVIEWVFQPTKATVDGIYKEALGVEGCPTWKRTLMWLGVRSNIRGGHWSKDVSKK